MNSEYGETNTGNIKVDNDVIKSIALRAAAETPGVQPLKMCYGRKLWHKLYKKGCSSYGVRLEFISPAEIRLALRLAVAYGVEIPKVAQKAQENVKRAIEYMTGLAVGEVSIKIKEMASPESGQRPAAAEESLAAEDTSDEDEFVSG